jgi:molybdopterin/thiamine biosynthesis adenylyltransferase
LTSAAAAERLAAASAIVVGAGALGSPAATYLASAGVGRVGVVDSGIAGPDDSRRAALLWPPDAGSNRAEAASAKLAVLAADAQVEPYPVALDELNARAIVVGSQVVLDCSGDPGTRALVNDACCAERIDLIVGDLAGRSGVLLAVRPGETACWRCAFPGAENGAGHEEEGAAAGAVAGVVGSMQALAAIEMLAGVSPGPTGRLLSFYADGLRQESASVARRGDCPACGVLAASPQSEGN